jgi:indole-3-glycerol phosphate synthase
MILDQILATKIEEVAIARASCPLAVMRDRALKAPAPRNFLRALEEPEGIAVIAEVKKASPSKGVIRADFDPVEIARAYEAGGAACLSVLTDVSYFAGSMGYLTDIHEAVALPLLRKDFTIDEYQVYEARAAGADAILLIVAAFSGSSAGPRTPADLIYLSELATSLGMAVLTEVHTDDELDVALASNSALIGINNRDLKSFHTSLDVTFTLAPRIPGDRLLVSESGIATHDDLVRLASAGAKAVLVGESLMRQSDVATALRSLRGQIG